MERTEHLLKELREKVKGLVEFMVSNGFDSADINLELNKEFTLCNVVYNNEGDDKNEFLYVFEESEELIKSHTEKNNTKHKQINKVECVENKSVKSNSFVDESSLSEDAMPKDTSKEDSEPKKSDTTNNTNKSTSSEPTENIINTTNDIGIEDNEQDNRQDNRQDNKQDTEQDSKKDNKPNLINFKNEAEFQRNAILSVLKEYNLIS